MRTWDDLQQPNPNERLLSEALTLLCDVHSRRLTDAARAHWMERLLPLAGSSLFAAMREACDDRQNFNLRWITERAAQIHRRNTVPPEAPKPLTDIERHASDMAAIKSLLWLHYEHGYDFADSPIAGIFARQRGIDPADVPAVVEAAKASYPRETIARWMEEQKLDGN